LDENSTDSANTNTSNIDETTIEIQQDDIAAKSGLNDSVTEQQLGITINTPYY
jgi:hypothetical protein